MSGYSVKRTAACLKTGRRSFLSLPSVSTAVVVFADHFGHQFRVLFHFTTYVGVVVRPQRLDDAVYHCRAEDAFGFVCGTLFGQFVGGCGARVGKLVE